MENGTQNTATVMRGIIEELGSIFRHVLPGTLVVGGAYLAYPEWFVKFNVGSWQHLGVLGVITLVLGNLLYTMNRYVVHQVIDLLLWLLRLPGPARHSKSKSYVDDVGRYVPLAFRAAGRPGPLGRHVQFRSAATLLLLNVAELLVVFARCHAPESKLACHGGAMVFGAVLALMAGGWQMIITRRIDYYVTTPPE